MFVCVYFLLSCLGLVSLRVVIRFASANPILFRCRVGARALGRFVFSCLRSRSFRGSCIFGLVRPVVRIPMYVRIAWFVYVSCRFVYVRISFVLSRSGTCLCIVACRVVFVSCYVCLMSW